jgi:site-specific DNA-cytosine methylase
MVSECKRLQTVPEWYEFPVSDTQAYKMLGNGWTVEVIAHLIKATQFESLEDETDEEQLDLFKMLGVLQ